MSSERCLEILKKFGDNFSFISSDPLFIDSLVTKSIIEAKERCDEEDTNTFYKTSLLCLKRNIRESINNEYERIPESSFGKTYTSTSLTTQKYLTVWITTNRGKFLNRW